MYHLSLKGEKKKVKKNENFSFLDFVTFQIEID